MVFLVYDHSKPPILDDQGGSSNSFLGSKLIAAMEYFEYMKQQEAKRMPAQKKTPHTNSAA